LWHVDDTADTLFVVRQGAPQVWLAGGDTPRVVARVAESYGAWLPYLPDADAYGRAWDRIRESATREIAPALLHHAQYRRQPQPGEELEVYARVLAPAAGRDEQHQGYCGGSVDECLGRYVDAGARYLILRIGSLGAHPTWSPSVCCRPCGHYPPSNGRGRRGRSSCPDGQR
jgi:hypothetical protein